MKVLLIALLCLTGCAGMVQRRQARTNAFEAGLKEWQGQNISALVKEWGMPKKEMKMPDGTQAYEFVFSDGVRTVSSFDASTLEGEATSVEHSCSITVMTTPEHKVDAIHWQGYCG